MAADSCPLAGPRPRIRVVRIFPLGPECRPAGRYSAGRPEPWLRRERVSPDTDPAGPLVGRRYPGGSRVRKDPWPLIDAPASGEGARQQLFDTCIVGEWQASRGNYAAVAKAVSRLRQTRIDSTMTDAGQDCPIREPLRDPARCDARVWAPPACRARESGGRGLSGAGVHLRDLLRRTAERREHPDCAALGEGGRSSRGPARDRAALERFSWAPMHMSTLLREEGRLAALTGDTARAVSAYRRYLEFRTTPQASLKPGVDSIRAQLAALERKE